MRLLRCFVIAGFVFAGFACGGSSDGDLFNASSPSEDGGTNPSDSGTTPTDTGTTTPPNGCAAGTADCDGNASNGCETSTTLNDGNCGACNNACAAGSSCQASACVQGPATVLAPQGQPNLAFGDLACLTLDGNDVYFTTGRQAQNGGAVYKIAKAGGTATPLATNQGNPRTILVDGPNLLWTNSGAGQVMRSAKDGTNATPIATGQQGPAGLAVDAQYIYWSNQNDGTIWRVDKAGTALPKQIVPGLGANRAGDIVIDGTNLIYTDPAGGVVRRGPSDGAVLPSVIASNLAGSRGIALRANTIVWAASQAAVVSSMAANGAAGSATPVAQNQQGAWMVALDGQSTYWMTHTQNGGLVKRANNTTTPLVTNQSFPVCLAVDATSVYWLNIGVGSIMRVAK